MISRISLSGGRGRIQHHPGRVRIAQDGGQRLPDFMGNCRAQLSHDNEPLRMRKLAIVLFELLPVRDVDGGADIADEIAIRRMAWHALLQNPMIVAVVPAQPVFDLEPLPGIECGLIGFAAVLRVLRMHALQPARSGFLLQATPGELQPALVEEVAMLVVIRNPEQHGNGVGHAAKSILTLPQAPLDTPSLLR